MENQLTVTVTKTSNGLMDYIQIMSDDSVSVNIVLIADKITMEDHREKFDSFTKEKEKE